MLRFDFSLTPVEAIEPWGRREGKPRLSWFGLSDGWYWLELDGREILRVDYQVVRLWEDLIELVPEVLVDVPADIARHLDDPDRWLATVARLQADDSLDADLVADGLAWWHGRQLVSAHLVEAPRVWLWRRGEVLSALCRPVPLFARQTVEQFVAELQRFDRAFIDAMAARVDALVRAGGRPGVDIDLVHLQAEQRDRATWLAAALAVGRRPPADWSAARRLLGR